MIDHRVQKFHPTVHRALIRWLDHSDKDIAAHRSEVLGRYPALALARSLNVAHYRAIDLWYCNAPLEKIAKASRIGIGPEVPASRLRVRMGRKYPIVFVVPEEEAIAA